MPTRKNGTTLQEGYNVGWKDYLADLALSRPGASQPTWAAFTNGIYAYSFSATIVEELQVSFHINHDYKPGSLVYPHIHWAPSNNNTGVVRWGFEYTVAKGHGQQAFPASQTIYVEQAGSGTPLMHQIAEAAQGQAFNTNLEPDSILLIRVFRDGNHANDTYNAVCFGLYCDLHIQSDRDTTLTKAPAWDT